MFERIPCRRAPGAVARPAVALPASLTIHTMALVALLAAGYLAVVEIQGPSIGERMTIFLPPPPPPAAKGGSPASAPERKAEPVEDLPEMIQPEIVPEAIPEPDESAPDGRSDDGGAGGSVGVPGGDPNGIDGGVPGGFPDGVWGGLPDGALPDLPAPPEEEEAIHLTGEVRPPILVEKVQPDYPEVARQARLPGKVILEIVVDRAGHVELSRILKSDRLFDQAAIEAVERWRYEPALQAGRPVKVYLTVVVDFRLS